MQQVPQNYNCIAQDFKTIFGRDHRQESLAISPASAAAMSPRKPLKIFTGKPKIMSARKLKIYGSGLIRRR
jgi:hypothetical protein